MIGDIGGTNLRIELLANDGSVIKKTVVATNDYHSLSQFLKEFFQGCDVSPTNVYGAVSVASKILKNKAVTMANYKWTVAPDGHAIKEEFGMKAMILLNDFEACGYAVPIINLKEVIILKGQKLPELSGDCKALLVGPGTGLGVCLFASR